MRAVDVMSARRSPSDVVRGQYDRAGSTASEVPGYREEEGVDARQHDRDVCGAAPHIDNWRWAGVPFFLRTGKRLPKRATEMAHAVQPGASPPVRREHGRATRARTCWSLRIQPDEGITLRFGAKVPGQSFQVRSVDDGLPLRRGVPRGDRPRPTNDCCSTRCIGDPTLFTRSDEVDQAWRIVDPILRAWEKRRSPRSSGIPPAPGARRRRTGSSPRRDARGATRSPACVRHDGDRFLGGGERQHHPG